MTHDYRTSHNYDDAEWWEVVYRQAFPSYVDHEVVTDRKRQLRGLDHIIHREGATDLGIDVKTRQKDYGDFAIEIWSDHERRVLSWARKDLDCDLIGYAVLPIQTCWILPFHPLREVVQERMHEWEERSQLSEGSIRRIEADNGRYTTVSLGVPRAELLGLLPWRKMVWWGSELDDEFPVPAVTHVDPTWGPGIAGSPTLRGVSGPVGARQKLARSRMLRRVNALAARWRRGEALT